MLVMCIRDHDKDIQSEKNDQIRIVPWRRAVV